MTRNLEDYLGEGWYGQTIGTKQKIDFSQSPEVLLPSGTVSKVGTATLIVAASNSLNSTKADYTCTGTNDHTTINTAIGALPTGGGRVILLEGTYNLGGAVVINKSNTVLEGQGAATILKLANSINTDCIQLGDGVGTFTNIKVKNLLVDGNMANQTTAGNGITLQINTSYCAVEGCTVQNTYLHNIYFPADSNYALIKDNILLGTKATVSGWNIYSGSSSGYGRFINNYAIGGDGGGFQINGSGNDIIEGNFISSAALYGLYLFSQQTASNNFILMTGGSGAALYCQSNDSTITGNYFNLSGGTCTAIKASGSGDNKYVGNHFYFNNVNPATPFIDLYYEDFSDNYIYLGNATAARTIIHQGSDHVRIANNFIYINGFGANFANIAIASGGYSYCQITGNKINGGGTGSKGIDCSGYISYSTITDNFMESIDTGIDVSNCANVKIGNNYIYQVTTTGIVATGLSIGEITDNFIVSGKNGILCAITATADHLNITGNQITGSGNEGMYLGRVQNSIIANNVLKDCCSGLTNTYAVIFLTDNGTIYSTYNIINGNTIDTASGNKAKYGIRENGASDGPNIITNNIVLDGTTAKISTQNASTDVSHNITA